MDMTILFKCFIRRCRNFSDFKSQTGTAGHRVRLLPFLKVSLFRLSDRAVGQTRHDQHCIMKGKFFGCAFTDVSIVLIIVTETIIATMNSL
jgi:hypothetical protein